MELKETPLTPVHKTLSAKIAPFAGYAMPIQYPSGILAEHEHTRTKASIFDICHMGEFMAAGPNARNLLAKAVSHDFDKLAPGTCRYGFILNEKGGIIDDCIIYAFDDNAFMIVVNGARREIDHKTLQSRLPPRIVLNDVSNMTAKIDLQGPKSLEVLNRVVQADFGGLGYFSFVRSSFDGDHLLVSRTGYTGELGYELYLDVAKAELLWNRLAADPEVKPAGLGARDTLRLEMGYPLYGQDLDEDHTPAEANMGRFLTSKAEYVGKAGAFAVRERLIGLALPDKRSARHHDRVLLNGVDVGVVTSGSYAPSVGHAVALAYVKPAAAAGVDFVVKTQRAEIPAKRTDPPFFAKGTARMKTAPKSA